MTGVRADAWAKANPIDAEEPKAAAERGRLIHPKLFGRPESEALGPASPQGPTGDAPAPAN